MPDQNIPTEEELKTLAAQLGCPSGEMGVEIGKKLHEINLNMTLNTFSCLEVNKGDHLLEPGHGNCSHLPLLLQKLPEMKYTGLEISELMKTEAERINANFVQSRTAQFFHYSGDTIPFKDQSFHRILTVNTIYFWPDPLKTLRELNRVLGPKGKISIGFGQAAFMQQMPVTRYGFNLYDSDTVSTLLEQSGFSKPESYDFKEPIENGTTDSSERQYSVVTATN